MNGADYIFKYELRARRPRYEPVLTTENIKPVGKSYFGMTRQQRALMLRKKIIP